MAVLSVTEHWNGREASRDSGNVREYKRTFLVLCSSMLDGPFTVGAPFTGIPTLFSYYVDQTGAVDLGARVHKYTVKQRSEDPLTWEVGVLYTSSVGKRPPAGSGKSGKAEQADKGSTDDNPLNRPAIVRVQFQKFDKPIDLDKNGFPLRNFAGTPFQSTVVDDTRTITTIDFNRPTLDRALIGLYQDTLNSDAGWWGTPLCCKMNITAESAFENGSKYWKYSVTIENRTPIDIGSDSMTPNKTAAAWSSQPRETSVRSRTWSSRLQAATFSRRGRSSSRTPAPMHGTRSVASPPRRSMGIPCRSARCLSTKMA
jgi:hypothetical protein